MLHSFVYMYSIIYMQHSLAVVLQHDGGLHHVSFMYRPDVHTTVLQLIQLYMYMNLVCIYM